MDKPKLIDTNQVILPEGLNEYLELLSINTHNNWICEKLKEGWVYGEKLDYIAKTHPSLVPYEELSETEKDYDRRTSSETIKALYALGFEVCKRGKNNESK